MKIKLSHLGETLNTGAVKLTDEGRDYRRIRQNPQDVLYMSTLGFVEVISSNVSAVKKDVESNDLLIRFHGGKVYRYINKANDYDNMMASNSKGRWVWQNLRYKNTPFRREGQIETPSETMRNRLAGDSQVESRDQLETLDTQMRSEHTRFDVPITDVTKSILKQIGLTSLNTSLIPVALTNIPKS